MEEKDVVRGEEESTGTGVELSEETVEEVKEEE